MSNEEVLQTLRPLNDAQQGPVNVVKSTKTQGRPLGGRALKDITNKLNQRSGEVEDITITLTSNTVMEARPSEAQGQANKIPLPGRNDKNPSSLHVGSSPGRLLDEAPEGHPSSAQIPSTSFGNGEG